MLVLGRREGQTVTLTTTSSEKITVAVLRTGVGLISLGIKAPRSVTILREEAVKREPAAA